MSSCLLGGSHDNPFILVGDTIAHFLNHFFILPGMSGGIERVRKGEAVSRAVAGFGRKAFRFKSFPLYKKTVLVFINLNLVIEFSETHTQAHVDP